MVFFFSISRNFSSVQRPADFIKEIKVVVVVKKKNLNMYMWNHSTKAITRFCSGLLDKRVKEFSMILCSEKLWYGHVAERRWYAEQSRVEEKKLFFNWQAESGLVWRTIRLTIFFSCRIGFRFTLAGKILTWIVTLVSLKWLSNWKILGISI